MDNIINEQNKKGNINIFYKFTLLYFFVVVSNGTFANTRITFWSSVGLIVISFLFFVFNSEVRLNKYIFWIASFNLFILLSLLWATDLKYAFDGIKGVVVRSIALCFISVLVRTQEDLYEIFKLYVYSAVITALYILMFIDISTLGDIRIGAGSLGEAWNANFLGMTMAFSAFMAYALASNEKDKYKRAIYFLLILSFGFVAFFSGSRKALFILLFSFSLYYLFASQKKKFVRVVLVLLSGLLLFSLVMNIPSLYEVLGSRIESLLAQFTGKGSVDKSTAIRIEMIEYGFNWFSKKPILGYGINNFRALYGNITGWYTYAHNNYIDLLVGVGVAGTSIYYSGYLYIIRNTLLKKQPLLVLAFTFIVTILITEIGQVSYAAFYIQLPVCLAYSAIQISRKAAVEALIQGSIQDDLQTLDGENIDHE